MNSSIEMINDEDQNSKVDEWDKNLIKESKEEDI